MHTEGCAHFNRNTLCRTPGYAIRWVLMVFTAPNATCLLNLTPALRHWRGLFSGIGVTILKSLSAIRSQTGKLLIFLNRSKIVCCLFFKQVLLLKLYFSLNVMTPYCGTTCMRRSCLWQMTEWGPLFLGARGGKRTDQTPPQTQPRNTGRATCSFHS